MIEALNAVDVDGDPSTTDDIVCANPAAVAEGCVPVNMFGFGAISPEAAEYIRAPISRRSKLTQEVAGGSIGGPVFELPAGAVDVVFGVEYRREEASDVPDIFTQTGISVGNQEQPIYGNYEVREGFFEVEAPLLKDLPLIEALTVGAAYRYSDYSTIGSTEAYTGRVSWEIIDSLRFRAQYARAVRALFAEKVAPIAAGQQAAQRSVMAAEIEDAPDRPSAPAQAIEGFLRSTGLTRDQLVTRGGLMRGHGDAPWVRPLSRS